MMTRAILIALCLCAGPLAAQDLMQQAATTASGGVVRVLDRSTGDVSDVEIASGQTETVNDLQIRLDECRFPAENPSGDAFALLTIHYRAETDPVFQGWMFASSPALNPMDHSRFDVWPLRCTTS